MSNYTVMSITYSCSLLVSLPVLSSVPFPTTSSILFFPVSFPRLPSIHFSSFFIPLYSRFPVSLLPSIPPYHPRLYYFPPSSFSVSPLPTLTFCFSFPFPLFTSPSSLPLPPSPFSLFQNSFPPSFLHPSPFSPPQLSFPFPLSSPFSFPTVLSFFPFFRLPFPFPTLASPNFPLFSFCPISLFPTSPFLTSSSPLPILHRSSSFYLLFLSSSKAPFSNFPSFSSSLRSCFPIFGCSPFSLLFPSKPSLPFLSSSYPFPKSFPIFPLLLFLSLFNSHLFSISLSLSISFPFPFLLLPYSFPALISLLSFSFLPLSLQLSFQFLSLSLSLRFLLLLPLFSPPLFLYLTLLPNSLSPLLLQSSSLFPLRLLRIPLPTLLPFSSSHPLLPVPPISPPTLLFLFLLPIFLLFFLSQFSQLFHTSLSSLPVPFFSSPQFLFQLSFPILHLLFPFPP
ncbi:hypothetical protein C7M84_016150 [Penaeus vannamei]|uniref:Uncharacterized protein n=1 Tax=Penaeus vannamei TaxID=6689 RepID=A0A423SNU6_PENVA|nr:hypothetical protein C7M84_016150 [Penaeus vannamei]